MKNQMLKVVEYITKLHSVTSGKNSEWSPNPQTSRTQSGHQIYGTSAELWHDNNTRLYVINRHRYIIAVVYVWLRKLLPYSVFFRFSVFCTSLVFLFARRICELFKSSEAVRFLRAYGDFSLTIDKSLNLKQTNFGIAKTLKKKNHYLSDWNVFLTQILSTKDYIDYYWFFESPWNCK